MGVFEFKFSMNFLMNALFQMGTAGVLAAGGWFVVTGETEIGTVVACRHVAGDPAAASPRSVGPEPSGSLDSGASLQRFSRASAAAAADRTPLRRRPWEIAGRLRCIVIVGRRHRSKTADRIGPIADRQLSGTSGMKTAVRLANLLQMFNSSKNDARSGRSLHVSCTMTAPSTQPRLLASVSQNKEI